MLFASTVFIMLICASVYSGLTNDDFIDSVWKTLGFLLDTVSSFDWKEDPNRLFLSRSIYCLVTVLHSLSSVCVTCQTHLLLFVIIMYLSFRQGQFPEETDLVGRRVGFGVTLIGLFFVSSLIGLISSGITSKVSEIDSGISVIMETNHIVICHWTSQVSTAPAASKLYSTRGVIVFVVDLLLEVHEFEQLRCFTLLSLWVLVSLY